MKKSLHHKIASWYAHYGRHDLPWRMTDDPYAVYLSEVMLQQTQVKTVLERYYYPFLERFPSLRELGKAPLDDVLKLWEGLGYYTRARNLHRTAQLTEGRLPETIEVLKELPGIGENTAHAIAAFAFHQPVPVMEANVKRILCRLHAWEKPTHKALWKAAYTLLDKENAYDYNQAMMDIGSMVCLPREPHCDNCPLETLCQGKTHPERYPAKKRKSIPQREETILIQKSRDRYMLRQRTERFLHGLWGFPSAETIPPNAISLDPVTQQYSHFKLTCRLYLLEEENYGEGAYFTLDEIDALAISKVDEKIIKVLLQSVSTEEPH
jgi:A/G-specific adenine glycosylase